MPRGISTETLPDIECARCKKALSPRTKWQKYHIKCGRLARVYRYLEAHGFKKDQKEKL